MIEFSLLVWYRDALENNWIFHVMILNEEWNHFCKRLLFYESPFCCPSTSTAIPIAHARIRADILLFCPAPARCVASTGRARAEEETNRWLEQAGAWDFRDDPLPFLKICWNPPASCPSGTRQWGSSTSQRGPSRPAGPRLRAGCGPIAGPGLADAEQQVPEPVIPGWSGICSQLVNLLGQGLFSVFFCYSTWYGRALLHPSRY